MHQLILRIKEDDKSKEGQCIIEHYETMHFRFINLVSDSILLTMT
jgi:hypothetical protein